MHCTTIKQRHYEELPLVRESDSLLLLLRCCDAAFISSRENSTVAVHVRGLDFFSREISLSRSNHVPFRFSSRDTFASGRERRVSAINRTSTTKLFTVFPVGWVYRPSPANIGDSPRRRFRPAIYWFVCDVPFVVNSLINFAIVPRRVYLKAIRDRYWLFNGAAFLVCFLPYVLRCRVALFEFYCSKQTY